MSRWQDLEEPIERLAARLEAARGLDVDGDLDAVCGALGGPTSSHSSADGLAVLAAALATLDPPAPRPAFRDELRATLVEEASRSLGAVAAAASPDRVVADPAPHPPLVERVRHRLETLRRSVAVAAASALGAMTIGGAGVVAAAQHATPGEALYGLKQATETLRLAVAEDEATAGQLHLQLAERRLDEIRTGADRLPGDTVIATLAEMDEHTEQGSDRLLREYVRTGATAPLRALSTFVERQRVGLRATLDEMPVDAAPFAQESLALLDRIEAQGAAAAMHGCYPCAEAATGTAVEGDPPTATEPAVSPGGGGEDPVEDGVDPTLEGRLAEDPGDGSSGDPTGTGSEQPSAPTRTEDVADVPASGPVGDVGRRAGETTGDLGDTVDDVVPSPPASGTTEGTTETVERTTDHVAETTEQLTDLLD